MIKKIALYTSFFFTFLDCMDISFSMRDYFSEQPNIRRRAFIFPLLKDCKRIQEARERILSIACISKKSHEQMMCPFFLKDMVSLLGEQFKESDMKIVQLLKIPRIREYAQMNTRMMEYTDTRKFPHVPLNCFSYLLDRGAHANCTFTDYNVTLLMRFVYINRFDLVELFVQKDADCAAYMYHSKDNQKQKIYCVRDCNMIYYPEKVYACLRAKETEKLRTALYIDKFLETKKAPSIITIDNNYLADALLEEAECHHEHGYGRALSNLYSNDKNIIKECVPHDIAQALCQFIDFKNSKKDSGQA